MTTREGPLRFCVDENGQLVVTAARKKRCVSLRFDPEGVDAFCGGAAPVALPWSAHGHVRWVIEGPSLDGWIIAPWRHGRGVNFGIALRVSGRFELASAGLLKATIFRWRRPSEFFESRTLPGRAVPIVSSGSRLTMCERERGTLVALVNLLTRRADLRDRLCESDRMAALATEMSDGLVGDPPQRSGAFRRDTIDVVYAIRKAGYFHEFGRPLGRSGLSNLDDVVERTRAYLDANPFRAGRQIDDAEIRRIVRRV